jgi:hypothetical protein
MSALHLPSDGFALEQFEVALYRSFPASKEYRRSSSA